GRVNARPLRPGRQVQAGHRTDRLRGDRRAPPGAVGQDRLPGGDPVTAGADGDRLPDRAEGPRGRRAPGAGAGARHSRGAGHRSARRSAMTLVVAHRGALTEAPENTMEAFRLGVAAGADGIELDVHPAADGQRAVIHDETLERTTDATGAVARLTMDEIRGADAGYRFSAEDGSFPFRGKGLRVPTLPQVLEWLPR